MDDLLTVISLISSTLLGVVVGGLLQYYIVKGQDSRRANEAEKKKEELDKKRKVTAYRRLKGIIDFIVWRTTGAGVTVRPVLVEEFEKIELTIAQNYDVLDVRTIAAWDTKAVTRSAYLSMNSQWVDLQFPSFIADVNEHYDELKYNAVPPKPVSPKS